MRDALWMICELMIAIVAGMRLASRPHAAILESHQVTDAWSEVAGKWRMAAMTY
jgi:hypothetical protein